MKNKLITAISGFFIGIVNSLFGAGGGIIAVPILTKSGLEKKQAHANAVAVILPITVLSAVLYVLKNRVEIENAYAFIPTGLLGAVLGTVFLKKISPKLLKKVFGIFIIYAGARLLFK